MDVLAAKDSDNLLLITFFVGECAYAINNYISCASPIDDICKYILNGDTVKNLCAILQKCYLLIYYRLYATLQ